MKHLLLFPLLFPLTLTADTPVPTVNAELPRVYIDTTYQAPTGTVRRAHTSAEFTAALNAAQPGDTIVLDAGVTYVAPTSSFRVPYKDNPNHKWIYVTSSNYAKLPPPGTRVSPADAVNMPKLVGPSAAAIITLNNGANYWRFVGLEMYSESSYSPPNYQAAFGGSKYAYSLVSKTCWPNATTAPICNTPLPTAPETLPDHIFFDRVYMHGDEKHDIIEGIQSSFSYFAVVDSYISDIHAGGGDCQAVAVVQTLGPIKVVNNYLEAATENILFGGSGGNWGNFVPSDIEIRNNHLYKPLSWVPVTCIGTGTNCPVPVKWAVKNLLEFKSGQRALIDNNILENSWPGGQQGTALVLTVRTGQSGDQAVVQDITFTNNVIKNAVMGFNTLAADYTCGQVPHGGSPGSGANCKNPGITHRVVIKNNILFLPDNTQQGFMGRVALSFGHFNGGTNSIANTFVPLSDFLVQHNTTVPFSNQKCTSGEMFDVPNGKTFPAYAKPPFTAPLTRNIWLLDNVECRQISGSWGQQGMNALSNYLDDPTHPDKPPVSTAERFYGNVQLVPSGDKVYTFTPHNTTASSIAFKDPANGDYSTPSYTDTSDGKPAGVDMSMLGKEHIAVPSQAAVLTAAQLAQLQDWKVKLEKDNAAVGDARDAVNACSKSKTPEQLAKYNAAVVQWNAANLTLQSDQKAYNAFLDAACNSKDGKTYRVQGTACELVK